MEPSDPVEIGRVISPHGRRGTVRVRATGSGKHLREGVEPLVAGRRRRISQARQTPKGFLIDLDGIEHRSEADGLRGEGLILDRRELDPAEEDEVYVDDLVGLTVEDEFGREIGTVEETFETAAHEVLVVRQSGDEDAPVIYVPFTLEHVPDLDLRGRRVTIRPLEA